MRSTLSPKRLLAVAGVTAISLLALAVPAAAQTGGSGPPGKAKLRKDGTAVAPADAPANNQAAIAAGNAIHTFPYRWGGGHRSFTDTGYDCSGAVSYVLHAAGFLSSPEPSGPLASSWGIPGRGRWITVFANASHAYMMVAGLRFDTSAVGERLNQGSGPRWRRTKRKAAGYTAKYFPGY